MSDVDVLRRVLDLAVEVSDTLEGTQAIDPDISVVTLGFDSVMLMRLLAAVQIEFGIKWNLDLPPRALDSLRSIAVVVTERLAEPGKQDHG